MEALVFFGVITGLALFLAILTIAIIKIDNWRYDRKDAKRRAEHPQLYLWFDECEEAGRQSCLWYNEQIAPLKREVDAILKEIDYYFQRYEFFLASCGANIGKIVDGTYYYHVEEVKAKIKKYVADNNLVWAKQWGW